MNKLVPIALATALLSSTAPLAWAQETETGADTGVEAEVDAEIDSEIDEVEADSSMEIDGYVSEQGEMSGEAGENLDSDISLDAMFDGIEAGDTVDLMLWTEVAATNDAEAQIFTEAEAKDAEDLKDLHARVESNDVLMTELEDNGFDADNVLSIQSDAEGNIKLYVDDRL